MVHFKKAAGAILIFSYFVIDLSCAIFEEPEFDDVNLQEKKTDGSRMKRFAPRANVSPRGKRRKQGDTYSDLKRKGQAREFLKLLQQQQNVSTVDSGIRLGMKRRKRYQYEEDYDWENGELDYVDRFQPKKEEAKFEKWAKNWQKNTLKFIFLFSFIMMILCCCCACCRKLCIKTKGTICFHIREWRDLCLCRDPRYRRMRHLADEYGFELDYSMYKKIKENYERGLENEGYGKVDLSGRT